MLLQCILISILTVFSGPGDAPWGGYIFKYIMQRPIIGGLLVGIILGDVSTGVMIGATMQMVYIGYLQVGGVGSMDMGFISFPCIALAMISNVDEATAIALATGLATVFTALDNFSLSFIFVLLGNLLKKGCQEGNDRKIFWSFWGLSSVYVVLERGVLSFLLMYFGSDAVNYVMQLLPDTILNAINSVAGFLPCIGMAAMLVYLADDFWGIIFFIFGFASFAYLGLTPTSIIIFAIVVAYFYFRTTSDKTGVERAGVEDSIKKEEEVL